MLTYMLLKTQTMHLSATRRKGQMLTYMLFKTQSMLLSATDRKGQLDADLHPVQNPEHPLVSNRQEGQTDADLHSVQNSKHTLVSNRQQRPARCWLAFCQDPEHALVSNKAERPARCWLTGYLKPRACSYQQQAGRTIQILTYILFKNQEDAPIRNKQARKGQSDPDLLPVQNQEYALVRNKQKELARSWLTYCSQPRACSCQYKRMPSKILTYILFTIKAHFC